jgi:vacuolar-type H+-ATPase subunit I/STV1
MVERVTAYVTEEDKQAIVRRAEQEDITQSKLAARYLRRGLRQDRENEISAESQAIEHLEKAVDDRLRRLEDLEDNLRDIVAKSGVYSIANFELLKHQHSTDDLQNALETGSNRLQNPDQIANALDDVDGTGDDDQGASDTKSFVRD